MIALSMIQSIHQSLSAAIETTWLIQLTLLLSPNYIFLFNFRTHSHYMFLLSFCSVLHEFSFCRLQYTVCSNQFLRPAIGIKIPGVLSVLASSITVFHFEDYCKGLH